MKHIINAHNIDEAIDGILKTTEDPEYLVVDLFCGAGGTTTGIMMAENEGGKIAKVIACVNHDANAILSHWTNHPEVMHFEEDIRTLNLAPLVKLVAHYRSHYPMAKLVLWASLECTNFSKAKGGQPRDADSRTLADHLHRYILALDPDYIQIENVVEFMSWGPLRIAAAKTHKDRTDLKIIRSKEYGRLLNYAWIPESKKNGKDWLRWCSEINAHGYRDEWKEMDSADFGAYTSRNRLFGVFAKPDCPIVWPEATHAKKPVHGMFGGLKKWQPVKEVLDFEDEGQSIFGRKKDLSPKTYERIYAGLIKYVAGGETAFIKKYFSGNPDGKVSSIQSPAGTITTVDHHAIVQPSFLLKYNSMDKNGKHTPPSIEYPAPVIACQSRLGLVQTSFIAKYYGNGDNISSIEQPAGTLTTKDRMVKVQTCWIDKQYSGAHNHQSIQQPAGTILTLDKHNLVHADHFVMNTNYSNIGTSIEEPLGAITANRKWHYIINPSWFGANASIDKPCPTLIARQDKAPLYLVATESGDWAIEVYETDLEIVKKIKQFMAAYGIIDIKMRMLKISELKPIQGFPENYKLKGTQSEQKKFIGNSVHPLVPKAWYEAKSARARALKFKVA